MKPHRHTLPELDAHDLTHLDAYTAAARLVIDGRPGHAFTLATRPPRPVVGHAAAIRAAAAAREPEHEPSKVDEKVRHAIEIDKKRRQRTARRAYPSH